MPVRLVVLDDSQYVRTYAGDTRPVATRFNQFVEAIARSPRFSHVRLLAPVRRLRIWEVDPALEPVDESAVEIVRTEAFRGAGDYLLRAAWLLPRNWRTIESAVTKSDLLWLRLPAMNALLALAAAHEHGVPILSWIDRDPDPRNSRHSRVPLGPCRRPAEALAHAVIELAGEAGTSMAATDEDLLYREEEHTMRAQPDLLVRKLVEILPELDWSER